MLRRVRRHLYLKCWMSVDKRKDERRQGRKDRKTQHSSFCSSLVSAIAKATCMSQSQSNEKVTATAKLLVVSSDTTSKHTDASATRNLTLSQLVYQRRLSLRIFEHKLAYFHHRHRHHHHHHYYQQQQQKHAASFFHIFTLSSTDVTSESIAPTKINTREAFPSSLAPLP